jgi:hypothetical protein
VSLREIVRGVASFRPDPMVSAQPDERKAGTSVPALQCGLVARLPSYAVWRILRINTPMPMQARPQEEQSRRLRHLNSVRELDDGKGIVPVISAVRLSRVDQATVESWSRLHKCFFILRYTTFGHGQTAYTTVDHFLAVRGAKPADPFDHAIRAQQQQWLPRFRAGSGPWS